MGLKKINGNERYMLKGSLRKNGFDRWRLVTSGFNKTTGEERTFLIEFYVVNPALSPKEVVLGFKSRKAQSAADLQYALAGTQAAINIQSEKYVQPSFVMVKAGVLGRGGKQINAYFPCSSLQVGKNDFIVKVSSGTDEECFLSDGECYGSVSVSQAQLNDMPELLSQAGLMAWNLKFKKQISFSPDYKGKGIHWSSFGGRTVFEGKVLLDGEEYVVIPKKSYGYVDKNWGKDFTSPFFHLSASNFTSLINGKSLDCSCLAVQGVYNERLSVLSSIEGNKIEFHADSHKKYTISCE